VGEDIQQQDIKAKFEDGILKLYVPKKEEAPKVETNNFINIEG
jgi:HSP20 family protein